MSESCWETRRMISGHSLVNVAEERHTVPERSERGTSHGAPLAALGYCGPSMASIISSKARLSRDRGFSLIELMMVLVVFLVVMGSIFRLMSNATARSSTEQAKLDMFQEAREFMDQMSRDLR